MGGRRSNGEGSLRGVAGRDLYQYRWTEWVDQGAVRRVDYAKTRAVAVTEVRRATMRAAAGRVGADSTAPLRVVAARWESRAGVAQRLAPSTVKAYSGVLHRHVLPVIGDFALREVRPSQVVDVLVIMDQSGLGAASQDHAVQALRAVFRMAAADDPWLANPAAAGPDPEGGAHPRAGCWRCWPVPMTRVRKRWWRSWPTPGCGSGRPCPCVGPTGRRTGRTVADPGHQDPPPEGRAGPREAGPAPTRLAAGASRPPACRTPLGRRGLDLASDVGTHWEVHNARARFNRLANGHPKRGLPPICPGATPHSLRHCAATILLEEGVPMRVVADLLGHSSTRVTEDVYAHVSTRLSAQAATVLNRSL